MQNFLLCGGLSGLFLTGERLQYTGQYDYVEFVAEYAPYDLFSLDSLGRTVDLFPHMSCMIKLDQAGRTYWGPRCFGAGIQNFLFADPRTVADVEECVRAVRSEYPHQRMPGLHGMCFPRTLTVGLSPLVLAS